MTDYKMTDEWRKKLTEFLGSNMLYTYDDDVSMLAVFRKIRDVGKWAIFYSRAMQIWYSEEEQDLESNLEDYGYEACFSRWLFLDNPERACCLAAMWLEEQG